MQVWTMASGKTAVIASGKPFRPSTTAISTSSTPRFLSSVMTRSQNLAPSVCSIPRDRQASFDPQLIAKYQRRFQTVKKSVRIKGRLGIGPSQKLVQDGIRNMRLFASRHGWAPFHASCPPTHEIPDSL